MIFAVIEAKRRSGRTCEWHVEMKDDLFRLEKEELENRCLIAINKANLLFWDKFVSCKFIRKIIL